MLCILKGRHCGYNRGVQGRAEIGGRLHITRERVRQIEAGAIMKLQHSDILRKLYLSLEGD
jgi:DNA-directed RNA polymerase sigma subunit (sigma70/sigma32)